MKSFKEFTKLETPKLGSLVSVKGKRLPVDSHDGDDTFPPAIDRYEVVDGFVIAYGLNGSEQVITAPSQKDLVDWMKQVDSQKKVGKSPVSWEPSHGGSSVVREIKKKIAELERRFKLPSIEIEFLVYEESTDAGSYSGGKMILFNPHLSKKEEVFLFSREKHEALLKTAVHEFCHYVYSRNTSKIKEAQKGGAFKKSPTLYGQLAGEFENIIENLTAFVLSDKFPEFDPITYSELKRFFS